MKTANKTFFGCDTFILHSTFPDPMGHGCRPPNQEAGPGFHLLSGPESLHVITFVCGAMAAPPRYPFRNADMAAPIQIHDRDMGVVQVVQVESIDHLRSVSVGD